MKQNRDLKVDSAEKALALMKAMLSANMMDNWLVVDDEKSENPNYFVKFGYFNRNVEDDDIVGCPCFLCDYEGPLPASEHLKNAIVYVKAFGVHNSVMTRMFFVEEGKPDFFIDEINDGDVFSMDDGRHYKYQDKKIIPL